MKSLNEKIENIETIDKEMKEKLFTFEKEREKTSSSRQLMNGGFYKEKSLIEPKCLNRNSCNICLQDNECVWCSKLNKCVLGDISGAYDGKCNAKDEFQYSKCKSQKICEVLESCTECIENKSCGWCAESKMCVEGNKRNPIGIMCTDYFHKMKQGRCSSHSNFVKK